MRCLVVLLAVVAVAVASHNPRVSERTVIKERSLPIIYRPSPKNEGFCVRTSGPITYMPLPERTHGWDYSVYDGKHDGRYVEYETEYPKRYYERSEHYDHVRRRPDVYVNPIRDYGYPQLDNTQYLQQQINVDSHETTIRRCPKSSHH